MSNDEPKPIEISGQTDVLDIMAELSVPDLVQKGFLKAVNLLLGAATDIPAAWLEGYSSRIRATTDARNALTVTAANELSKGFGGESELANRAFAQQASRILGEQVNLEDVVAVAAAELGANGATANPSSEPDDDWLNSFRNEASQKSSEEMKYTFGKILAGEIRQPGSFSIKSVRTLGLMDLPTASLFRKFCNMTFSIPLLKAATVCSLGSNAGSNSLQQFGMSFDQLVKLQEHGLIISDFNSWRDIGALVGQPIPIKMGNHQFMLSPLEGFSGDFKMHGVALTSVGRELFEIVDVEDDVAYMDALTKFLESNMITLVTTQAAI